MRLLTMPVSRRNKPPQVISKAQAEQIFKNIPLAPLLTKALGSDETEARRAIGVLSLLARSDRLDAELCLYGLLLQFRGHWELATAVANDIAFFNSERAARALFHEIRTVKSTPAARAYLGRVILALSHFDPRLALDELKALANDPAFSAAWRRKFADLAREMAWRVGG
jgi:hypothetical protein